MPPAASLRQAFVVVGEPPAAIGVRSNEIARVLEVASFVGARTLDLSPLQAPALSADTPSHVLVLKDALGEFGLVVRGRLELLSVAPGDVLELPLAVARNACMSHVITLGGVPAIPVLDARRIAKDLAEACPEPNAGPDPET